MSSEQRHSGAARPASTLVELLRRRAGHEPGACAYTFLIDGEEEEATLTYSELDREARAIGALLQDELAVGQRALLLYPPGLPYITAFFGCLYAGVVAVPAYPPRHHRHLPRLQSVAADAQAAAVLTTAPALTKMRAGLAEVQDLAGLRWITTDGLGGGPGESWQEPEVTGETLAFLQYTSGSTAAPKGVMVSHGNLLHNMGLIQAAFGLTGQSNIVSWLPLYHDMGLIGNLLQALYLGAPCTLLSPAAFLQRPLRWLQAISRHRAALSGGPNFAYDLCVDRIAPEQRAGLDLSSWATAFNGAEPVRAETLERFAQAFAPCGFRREACRPVYGLAEATLFVSGKLRGDAAPAHSFQAAALERHQAIAAAPADEARRVLVSCGQAPPGLRLVIADPELLVPCPPGEVGEIWVAGESVTQGYWDRGEETGHTFRAYLIITGEGPFLRTGDLGFIRDGELFVTGRLKDLLIIRGRNHYPQDIELTARRCHTALTFGMGAAFTVEVGGEERLVILHEVDRHFRSRQAAEAIAAIRQALAEDHDLEADSIVLVKTGSLRKTSSGKIQRHLCRQEFLSGGLELVAASASREMSRRDGGVEPQSPPSATQSLPGPEAIRSWLVAKVAERLSLAPARIDTGAPFSSLGLNSVNAVSISGDLEDWLGRRLSPTLLYDYPTIGALARHLGLGDEVARTIPAACEEPVDPSEPIAIIGMGCRFPGAPDLKSYWALLRDGREAISEAPAARWDAGAFYAAGPDEPGKANTKWGGFLQQIDQFDPRFFGISPREAARMDPQQRLLLEVTWEALEDGGQVVERLAGTSTGVFIGISDNEYRRLQFSSMALIDAYAGTGNALSVAANRLSYLFDWRGPSMAVDTACSSSLVAVHLACRSLSSGEAALAVAGGVNLMLSPALMINFAKAGVMAPDGRCKAFDARANGYVRGEGAGVVILKRLSAALADGDPIYAVILGTATNQDGRTNGLMAPSREAQEAVLEAAYRRAGVSPGDVRLIEAHGTGTFLGDQIEAKALGAVLGRGRRAGEDCALGSVKTNIGHLEAAAGVAGLIKVALSLKHRQIPPSLNFETANPHIPFGELPLRVQRTLGPWPEGDGRALAGVSSFGFGGTNAHAVLADAALSSRSFSSEVDGSDQAALLTLTAQDPEALRSVVSSFREFLSSDEARGGASLRDVCYTADARRAHHNLRLSCVGSSAGEMVEQFGRFLRGEAGVGVAAGRRRQESPPRIVFVFPGQGSQWPGMGRDLMAQEPVFREAVEDCDRAMRGFVDWSLADQLRAEDEPAGRQEIDVVQPAIFALQVALAALWRSWGVEPQAVVGQSMGEVAAAHVCGSLGLADAARVICRRSQLLKRASGRGGMAAVELSLEQAVLAIAKYGGRLSIAVSNSPTSTVLAGDPAALTELAAALERRGVFCRMIKVDVASHTPQMEPLRADLLRALDGLRPRPAAVPIYSTVTGEVSDGRDFGPAYWMRNLREPVLFAAAVDRLAGSGHDVFLELSPHPLLLSAVQQCLHHAGRAGKVLPSLAREEQARAVMLRSLGELFVDGQEINWGGLYTNGGACVQLPTYPWQRERCWFEEGPGSVDASQGLSPGQLHAAAAPPETDLWETVLDRGRLGARAESAEGGAVLVPSATYFELALTAASETFGSTPQALSDIEFQSPLVLPASGSRAVRVVFQPFTAGRSRFRVYSQPADPMRGDQPWVLHLTGAFDSSLIDRP